MARCSTSLRKAGAGGTLKDCPMTSFRLSVMGQCDDQITGADMLRTHRIGRLC
jgi:hypothetical protein